MTTAGPGMSGTGRVTARYEAAKLRTRYYTPDVRRAAFALPAYFSEDA